MVSAGGTAIFDTAVDQQIIVPLALNPTLLDNFHDGHCPGITLCSTSETNRATLFSFPILAPMALMVFGPMLNSKLFFLYTVLFTRRFVIGLAIGLFVLITSLICSRLLFFIYAGQPL